MQRSSKYVFSSLVCLSIAVAELPAQDLLLTEFMANNVETLTDKDGERSDWIEVYAAGDAPIQLAGWSLSDLVEQPDLWVFPEMELAPGEFLVVFASGKDRRDPEDELHTNFRLSRGGEFLGLFQPDGTAATFFGTEYPGQQFDASYGLTMQTETRDVVPAGAAARLLVTVRRSDLPSDWFDPDLDDSQWVSATTGIGYDSRAADSPAERVYPADLIQTDVGELMEGKNASVFLRIPFDVTEPAGLGTLTLQAKYDSGFIAYVNGVEVARGNADRDAVNARATSPRSVDEVLEFQPFKLEVPPGLVRAGRNVLGIQAQNDEPASPDFLFVPVLQATTVSGVNVDEKTFFAFPTPGLPNPTAGQSALAQEPRASVESTHFVGSIEVELTADSADAVIRYTVDGTVPTEESSLYTEPLHFTEITRLQARNFEPGLVPSWYLHEDYLAIDQSVAGFSSDLPLFVISTFGLGTSNNLHRPMLMQVIDRDSNGRSFLDGERHFIGHGLIKQRGSSTRDFPKKSYGFEIQDRIGEDDETALLGLPADSDWVLQGPSSDYSLMRNAVAYELGRRMGNYAPRTRHCEVFVNVPGGENERGPLSPVVTQEDYAGVYVLTEKIKRGKDRVDVDKLGLDDAEEPEVSGGYMLKIDPADPGEMTILGGGIELNLVYPKADEISTPQTEWIVGYLNDMWDAMREDFSQPVADISERAYAQFLDLDSWLDYHIVNEFAKNADGTKKSSYFSKPEGEPIVYGPLWDMNLSLGPHDPVGWSGPKLFHWWGQLFQDPVFVRRYVERYSQHREGALNSETIFEIVDGFASQLQEAYVRDFERWEEPFFQHARWQRNASEWAPAVEDLKTWVTARFQWLDAAWLAELTSGGPIQPGDLDQNAVLNIGDPVALVTFLFSGVGVALPCGTQEANRQLADGNGDGRMDVSDAVHLLNFLFLGGAPHDLGRECVAIADCPVVCQ